MLFIYGYAQRTNTSDDFTQTINFETKIRGKNAGTEEWTEVATSKQSASDV
jgi:hypothetical protein